jgi:DNA-binding CsgD family transcriptional regulator
LLLNISQPLRANARFGTFSDPRGFVTPANIFQLELQMTCRQDTKATKHCEDDEEKFRDDRLIKYRKAGIVRHGFVILHSYRRAHQFCYAKISAAELWVFSFFATVLATTMSTKLCVHIQSKITGDCKEVPFFEAERWTMETEKKLMDKMQELLGIARHCGNSFDVTINLNVKDLNEAVFLIKKKINNTCEIKNQKLSLREIEVLGLIMQGYTTPEIADKLFVCFETVKSHRKNILLKTGAKNTAALIHYYHQTFFEKTT